MVQKRSIRKHQHRAQKDAMRRRSFFADLVIVIFAGGVFGYFFGLYLGEQILPVPNEFGQTVGTLQEFERDSRIAVLLGYGVIYWPIIFCCVFFVWRKIGDRKHEAELAAYDTQARDDRVAEKERQIEEAKASGALDRFQKGPSE